jgi:hypothetical protein
MRHRVRLQGLWFVLLWHLQRGAVQGQPCERWNLGRDKAYTEQEVGAHQN